MDSAVYDGLWAVGFRPGQAKSLRSKASLLGCEPRISKGSLASGERSPSSFHGHELQPGILCDDQRQFLRDTSTPDRYAHGIARPAPLDSFFEAAWAGDGDAVEREQLIAAIEAGSIQR